MNAKSGKYLRAGLQGVAPGVMIGAVMLVVLGGSSGIVLGSWAVGGFLGGLLTRALIDLYTEPARTRRNAAGNLEQGDPDPPPR